jgi:metal-responsive CopG/Arc/MetJ family transcriptional regulator
VSQILTVSMSDRALNKLNRAVKKIKQDQPDLEINRSRVVRNLVEKYLDRYLADLGIGDDTGAVSEEDLLDE